MALLTIGVAIAIIVYFVLQVSLHVTQSKREPRLAETRVPFLDSAFGIARQRVNYLASLRYANTIACQRNALTLAQYSLSLADPDFTNALPTSIRRACSTFDSDHTEQSQC